MRANELRPAPGARKARRRVGRGNASGNGTYAGKGMKGQKARSGGGPPPHFEGGQQKIVKRLPEQRGEVNIFRIVPAVVNVRQLGVFSAGDEVTSEALWRRGILSKQGPIKILGDGELAQPLTVRADAFSETARAKITAVGGTAELIEKGPRQRRSRSRRSSQK
jgi:large subunit ribosomal protein L15